MGKSLSCPTLLESETPLTWLGLYSPSENASHHDGRPTFFGHQWSPAESDSLPAVQIQKLQLPLMKTSNYLHPHHQLVFYTAPLKKKPGSQTTPSVVGRSPVHQKKTEKQGRLNRASQLVPQNWFSRSVECPNKPQIGCRLNTGVSTQTPESSVEHRGAPVQTFVATKGNKMEQNWLCNLSISWRRWPNMPKKKTVSINHPGVRSYTKMWIFT